MLLGSGKDKDGMMRGLFESLEECIERRSREHVYLVDDVNLILAYLGWDAYLVDKLTDVVDTVV